MKLDLNSIPFTRYGSYMAVSYMASDFRLFGRPLQLTGGLYLRSLRGDTMMQPVVGRIVPTCSGEPSEYTYEADETVLTMRTKTGEIHITYADPKTILIEGTGKGIGVRIDDIAKGGVFDFIHEIPFGEQIYYEINSYKNQNKFLCAAQNGSVRMNQCWNEKTASDCSVDFTEENGQFLAVIEEEKIEWSRRNYQFVFEDCVKKTRQELAAFIQKLPAVPEKYEESREAAGYILWCNTVQKEGFLTRDAIYPSNNWMLGAFSWDQCFPAMALAEGNPEMAWDQLMIMFDYQHASGRIPDYVTDTDAHWNYCKPPIHGWTLLHMMEHMQLTKTQEEEAYKKLGKWTDWWYTYRDSDHDGVCEYYHGNDSGWDNATVFRVTPTVETPDVSAYLILQMECLRTLAEELGKTEEAAAWKVRSEQQLSDLLEHSFREDKPTTYINRTHEEVKSDCLLPYLSLILGKRLPETVRDGMLKEVKQGGFITEYGVATERVTSKYYDSDGYWRGPVWAPTTVLMLDALYQLGEDALVRELAEKFANMIEKSGFAENYDALTGEGRRDRAFTWTAAAFLIIAHRYLL